MIVKEKGGGSGGNNSIYILKELSASFLAVGR